MANETPKSPATSPEQRPNQHRRDQYRPILTLFTALLGAGLLAAALWPGANVASKPAVSAPPSVAEPTAPNATDGPGLGSGSASDPGSPSTPEPGTGSEPQSKSPSDPSKPPGADGPDSGQEPYSLVRLPDLPEDQPSRLVVHGDRSCQQIALTYDAGSGADAAEAILDVLKKHGVISTFFLTGRWVERYEELARRIADEGHEIANHTYSHPDLTTLSPEEIIAEVKQGEETIHRITAFQSRPLFREPFGAFNEEQRLMVRKAGFSYSIYWDLDTIDWKFPGVEQTVQRIMTMRQNGSIVLMHLNVPDSAVASDIVIPQLKDEGYSLVTVSQVMNCPP